MLAATRSGFCVVAEIVLTGMSRAPGSCENMQLILVHSFLPGHAMFLKRPVAVNISNERL